jgi:hypothetical protein
MLASSDAARRTDEQITGYPYFPTELMAVLDFKLYVSMTRTEHPISLKRWRN